MAQLRTGTVRKGGGGPTGGLKNAVERLKIIFEETVEWVPSGDSGRWCIGQNAAFRQAPTGCRARRQLDPAAALRPLV